MLADSGVSKRCARPCRRFVHAGRLSFPGGDVDVDQWRSTASPLHPSMRMVPVPLMPRAQTWHRWPPTIIVVSFWGRRDRRTHRCPHPPPTPPAHIHTHTTACASDADLDDHTCTVARHKKTQARAEVLRLMNPPPPASTLPDARPSAASFVHDGQWSVRPASLAVRHGRLPCRDILVDACACGDHRSQVAL